MLFLSAIEQNKLISSNDIICNETLNELCIMWHIYLINHNNYSFR